MGAGKVGSARSKSHRNMKGTAKKPLKARPGNKTATSNSLARFRDITTQGTARAGIASSGKANTSIPPPVPSALDQAGAALNQAGTQAATFFGGVGRGAVDLFTYPDDRPCPPPYLKYPSLICNLQHLMR